MIAKLAGRFNAKGFSDQRVHVIVSLIGPAEHQAHNGIQFPKICTHQALYYCRCSTAGVGLMVVVDE